jgi:hypothetical protein
MDNSQDMTGLNLPQPSSQGSFGAQPVSPAFIPQGLPMQPPAIQQMPPAQPTALQPPLAQPQGQIPDLNDNEKDDDSLDIEWVQKAKAIVEQTHDDPHVESQALNQLKADYLKNRYGKDLKI